MDTAYKYNAHWPDNTQQENPGIGSIMLTSQYCDSSNWKSAHVLQ